MKWVVLGDIGWTDLYHLGDEAMTEVALAQLRLRGAEQVTLVSAHPEVAERFYGTPAVRRIGFHRSWGRVRCAERLAGLADELASDPPPGTLQHAIREADAVLIAGGGNLTSEYFGHLYERLAFARIARHYGVPLIVTSQTVGPTLRDDDRPLIAEIVDTAVYFGAREGRTAELVRGLAKDPSRVVRTFDDAVLMQPRRKDEAAAETICAASGIVLGDPDAGVQGPILASFTADPGASGFSPEEYLDRIVSLLDGLGESSGADILLVPHSGSIYGESQASDEQLNQEIMAKSRTGRLKATTRMPTAREQAAIMRRSRFSVSSRYHPLVFGAQAAVPTLGVALSKYSVVRMRGALENMGLERWVVPSALWHELDAACAEAVDRSAEISEHLGKLTLAARETQSQWWDTVLEAGKVGKSGALEAPKDILAPAQLNPAAAWSTLTEAVTPVFELWCEEKDLRSWAEADLQAALSWKDRALRSENRKIVRVVDRVVSVLKGSARG